VHATVTKAPDTSKKPIIIETDFDYHDILEMLEQSCKLYANNPLFGTRVGSQFEWISYKEFEVLVKKFRNVLKHHNIGKHHCVYALLIFIFSYYTILYTWSSHHTSVIKALASASLTFKF
jgi:long-subunit acyl-CoA synthetase (AMP-forming)